jgi:hypothetical protein
VSRFNIVQAQVELVDFIFNLEYKLPLFQHGYHIDSNKVSMLTWPKNPSEMSETQWPHILHISLN